ncbi:2,3-dihydro-2,3-dihydroxybenzoate dehydrogenase [Rhizobiaceae bacterium CRRU44]|uniref:2,3-dihydro-2,3-dihydroxybenzoate dehydrogenase n=1 Tax=Ferranicluibacter rubi TaxID=2715133 RepID=A0AA44CCT3_9HYPH|nr:2,3-dihydro-2,3-dihydroxybenzoate dehydrogenase [Ferranicluibacter rubi]NHT76791.1 2,3-dihydro-2,3-dihydroxybenzoate dehydrogenase [Ferranicluibacter rubi]
MRLTGFEDTVAFVTGAGSGIGLAVTRLLLDEGANVVATDVALGGLRSLVHDNLHVAELDVRRNREVDHRIRQTIDTHGRIDFGVNVAGVLSTKPIVETADDEWEQVFAVNTTGVFHVSRALARHMMTRRKGSIVTVASNAAGIPRQNMAAYAASKAASTMFTRCLGLELAPYGIRCNIVAPGSTLTPMQTGMWTDPSGEDRVIEGSLPAFKTGIPLGKLATPDDIANSVVFLLSDRASHITMADLYVDGGATLRG